MIKLQGGLASIAQALLIVGAAISIAACGGGGGSGGSSGGSSTAELSQGALTPDGNGFIQPVIGLGTMGVLQRNQDLTGTSGVAGIALVSANNVPAPNFGAQNYIEINFSTEMSKASILAGGITLSGRRNNANAYDPVPFFLDETGMFDDPARSSNMVTGDVVPATVRLYVRATNAPTDLTPVSLAPNGYRLRLSRALLKSASGGSFCAAEEGGQCLSTADAVYHFTVGGQNTPTPGADAMLSPGPTPALPLPSQYDVQSVETTNSEIRIFFSSDVDFHSIVGNNPATGLVNVTSQDPFCSVPFPMAGGAAAGSNLAITYTLPMPGVLPPNYGYIVYMPNPFTDASEVRIRFIDITLAQPFDDPAGVVTGAVTTQNYAIPSAVWTNRPAGTVVTLPSAGMPGLLGLGTASSTTGQPTDTSTAQLGFLELPPPLALPSTIGLTQSPTLRVQFFSPANGGAVGTSIQDAVMGVTDRGRRPLAADIDLNYTVENSVGLANNPEPPDLHIVVNGSQLDGFSTAGNTVNAVPGNPVSGNLFPIAAPINDPTVLSSANDVIFGAFINPANAANNPPRRINNALAIMQGIDPGTPFPPGGTPEAGGGMQPLGARLYVVDNVEGLVKIFNSNTFQPLGIIPGVASPFGLSVGTNFLYISNFGQDTIQRVGVIPGAPLFHQVVGTTSVGPGPTAVSVQGNTEDVAVINSLGNSVGFVDIPSFTNRASFAVGMGPTEVVATSRWTGMGTTFAYHAYITNILSDSVSVYESDSPIPNVTNGMNGKMLSEFVGFSGPSYGAWTLTTGPTTNLGAQGMYVANSTGTGVSYFAWTMFNLGPMPGFMGPPPSRTFNRILEYTPLATSGINGGPGDVAIDATILTLAGAVNSLVVTFPGSGRVVSFGANNGIEWGSAQVPGNRLFTSIDQ